MKKTTIYVLLLFLLACNEGNENVIGLFNGIDFRIYPGEKEVLISKEIKRNYHMPDSIENIPLNKYLEGEGYKIYIGIPFQTSIDKYYAAQRAMFVNDSNMFKTDKSFYNFTKVDSTYYIEVLVKREKSLFFVKGQTLELGLLKTIFTEKSVINRFAER